MKIGIVSDIHGHLEPLQRAVSLFVSREVDLVICAGDLVDGGWDDDAVVDYIRSSNIVSVRGNHDREAASNQIDFYDLDGDFEDEIGSYRIQYLDSLPLSCSFLWEGVTVYLTHGAPWSDTHHVFPNASAATCQRVIDTAEADIVILGHTHIPMKIQIGEKWILNPGAVCGNRDDLKRTCGILELPQLRFELFDIETSEPLALDTIMPV